MGLSGERGAEGWPTRGEEGVGSATEDGEGDEPALCWRMKRARRDGVLGRWWAGESAVGLPRTGE